MKALSQLIQKAAGSKRHLWLLNRLMNRSIKFNKPHGFKVIKISPECAQTFAPYHKKNFNHVRGIHACAIATVGELAAGLILMYHFSPQEYRIILSNLEIKYEYQAKKNIIATAELQPAEKALIMQSLKNNPKVIQTVTTTVKDDDEQIVAVIKSTWQIKAWDAVRTQV